MKRLIALFCLFTLAAASAQAADAPAPNADALKSENARLKKQVNQLEERNRALFQSLKDLSRKARPDAPDVPEDKKEALKKSIDRLLQFGYNFYDKSEYEAAWPLLKSAVDLGADKPEAFFRLAYSFSVIDEYDDAADYYQKAIDALSKDPEAHKQRLLDAHNNLAVVLERAGKTKEAAEAIAKLTELNPNYAAAWYNLAVLYEHELKQPEKAVEAYRRHVVLGGARAVSAQRAIRELLEAPKKQEKEAE